MIESFGARLRQQREGRAIDLSSIAEQTKIKRSLLEGLERDDVSQWPSGIFRRAYVRTYAQIIGLDPDVVVREFLEAYPEPVDLLDAAVAAEIEESARRNGAPTMRLRTIVDSAIGSLARLRRPAALDAPGVAGSRTDKPARPVVDTPAAGWPDFTTPVAGAYDPSDRDHGQRHSQERPRPGPAGEPLDDVEQPDISSASVPALADAETGPPEGGHYASGAETGPPEGGHYASSGELEALADLLAADDRHGHYAGSREPEALADLVTADDRPAPSAATADGSHLHREAGRDHSLAAMEARLVTVANVCTELGRVRGRDEVMMLLEDSARALDARGLIVWLWDESSEALRPVLVHGYSDHVLAHLPTVTRDADNATAEAFRSARTCEVAASARVTGALVVPLLVPQGCVGVLAVELQPGVQPPASLRALATILAAALTQIVYRSRPASHHLRDRASAHLIS